MIVPGASALVEHIENVPLIDHHVHGYWLQGPDRRRFENGLNEANIEPLADFDSAFDSQLGFAVRAHCAPLLGLPGHADPEEYWHRRCEHSDLDLARLFLSAAKVSDWLVDTGFGAGVAGLDEISDGSGGRVHEIVRLESVAEAAVRDSDDYAAAFERILHERSATAVATKSIFAYRGGLRRRPVGTGAGRSDRSRQPVARRRGTAVDQPCAAAVRAVSGAAAR